MFKEGSSALISDFLLKRITSGETSDLFNFPPKKDFSFVKNMTESTIFFPLNKYVQSLPPSYPGFVLFLGVVLAWFQKLQSPRKLECNWDTRWSVSPWQESQQANLCRLRVTQIQVFGGLYKEFSSCTLVVKGLVHLVNSTSVLLHLDLDDRLLNLLVSHHQLLCSVNDFVSEFWESNCCLFSFFFNCCVLLSLCAAAKLSHFAIIGLFPSLWTRL